MKLTDLNEVAPEGARFVILTTPRPPQVGEWLEIEEVNVRPVDYPELLARVDALRHRGKMNNWRVVVHTYGATTVPPLVQYDFPAINPLPAPPVTTSHADDGPLSARTAWIEYDGETYAFTPGAVGVSAFHAVVASRDSGSAMVPEKPVCANVHELTDALGCAFLAALVHGRRHHPGGVEGASIPVCSDSAFPLYYLAKMFILAVDGTGTLKE